MQTELANSSGLSVDHSSVDAARKFAQQAFSRAAGAPLISGNSVRLLIDARENFPAWLDAIAAATRHVHFESYVMHEDSTGQTFADALIASLRMHRSRKALAASDHLPLVAEFELAH